MRRIYEIMPIVQVGIRSQGIEEAKFIKENKLKLFYAEWFLATDRGVPYFENIFGANKNKDIVASIFTNEILKESDVTSVVNVIYDLNSNTRKFSYGATINSIYGSTEFNFNG